MYGLTLPAYADLIDRGGGLIFDTDLNITWLQDANLSGQQMNWQKANDWANNLVFGGFDDWRLPKILIDNPPGGPQTGQGEMDLLYAELGNPADPFKSGPFINIQHGVLGANDEYWYRTELLSGSLAWQFSFASGDTGQDFEGKDDFVYAWAVRDGDVAAVPEPNTLLLLGSGLIGMVAFRKKFKK